MTDIQGHVRTNTKHIAVGDVFFCFENAEKFLTKEIFEKVEKIHIEKDFIKRNSQNTFLSNIDISYFKNKIIEYDTQEHIKEALVNTLKERYVLPRNIMTITGTKGKTSTSWFIMQIFGFNNIKCGYIGTIGCYFFDGEKLNKINKEDTLTTPSIDDLYRFLDILKNNNVDNVIFETSSHALQQGRIEGLTINIAGFTNLSQDHLDYHKTMQDYFSAKSLLFTKYLSKNEKVIINYNNEYGKKIAELYKKNNIQNENIYYLCQTTDFINQKNTIHNDNILFIKNIKQYCDHQVINFKIQNSDFELKTNIIGEFQAYNIGIAILFGIANEIKIENILNCCNKLTAPLGRMQRFKNENIFIDYAHTPQSLKESLKLLSDLFEEIILVFGCGGDRDKMKRPLMYETAKRFATNILITNDNPRTENDVKIIEDIICFDNININNPLKHNDFVLLELKKINDFGTKICNKDKIQIIKERAIAIQTALQTYDKLKHNKKISVLIAGKGHENYQIIGKEKKHFDDYEEVSKYYNKNK